MILIELEGEKQLVESLEGYDGWTVLAKDASAPPSDHCSWNGAEWIEDAAAKDEADLRAGINSMQPADILAMVDARIAEQASRIDNLAAAVAVDPATLSPPAAESDGPI